MNEHIKTDPWAFWRLQLAGGKPEIKPGHPEQGFYRNRTRNNETRALEYEAVAIWYEGETLNCQVIKADKRVVNFIVWEMVDELFARCCRSPITVEQFNMIDNGGAWPDLIEPADIATADMPLDAALAVDLETTKTRAAEWLKNIGGKIETQEHADKIANYATAFAALETKAEKQRKAEKEPHLEAGRAVDAKWKIVTDNASRGKVWAKAKANEFATAEAARRVEAARVENARLQAKHAKAVEAQSIANEALLNRDIALAEMEVPAAPIAAPAYVEPERVKIGTSGKALSQRTYDVWTLTDVAAALRFLADRNTHSDAFTKAVQFECEALCRLGIAVPGVVKSTETKVV